MIQVHLQVLEHIFQQSIQYLIMLIPIFQGDILIHRILDIEDLNSVVKIAV